MEGDGRVVGLLLGGGVVVVLEVTVHELLKKEMEKYLKEKAWTPWEKEKLLGRNPAPFVNIVSREKGKKKHNESVLHILLLKREK